MSAMSKQDDIWLWALIVPVLGMSSWEVLVTYGYLC